MENERPVDQLARFVLGFMKIGLIAVLLFVAVASMGAFG